MSLGNKKVKLEKLQLKLEESKYLLSNEKIEEEGEDFAESIIENKLDKVGLLLNKKKQNNVIEEEEVGD